MTVNSQDDKKQVYTPINKGQFTLESPERESEFEARRGFGVEEAYKQNRLQWSEYPRRQFVSDYPLHVDIELASVCNLNCPMCYTITPEFKQKVNVKLMDFELYKKLVDECSAGGVYSIRLSLRGESFLHKRIIDCVRYAKEKGIKEVSTLTNGLKLDEQMFSEIMEAGIDWITISFDGLGETYEQIRRPAKYDRAVEKIRNYQQIKKNAGRVKPLIKIQSVLPAIEKDPKAFYDVFAPIADMVSANPLIDFMQDKAKMPKIPNFTCPQIFQRLTIGADGLCMMCANDEVNEHVVGDVNKQTIHEVWHGDKMKHVRELHIQHKGAELLGPCKHCYLPLETYDADVNLGDRSVVAEKYVSGVQKVSELDTPEKYKRNEMDV